MASNLKEMVVAELEDVPQALLPEVLRFVRFIKSQPEDIVSTASGMSKLVTVTPEQVSLLSGMVDFSGNALTDTEQLYAE